MADFRIAPFSIYSSSVETGYISEISASFRPHIDLTNMHEDRYGNYSDAPIQGPFTYKYVGGNQQRHIPLNEGTDTPLTRPELFDIYMTGGVLEVRGPDTAGGVDRPRAPYFREPMAKRPLNIENIQMRTGSAIIGNYSNDYEFIQTVGRTSNNRAFVEANGVGFIGDPTRPYNGLLITQFISGTRDVLTGTALPDFDLQDSNKFIFVNRFNAPGSAQVSSRGALDTYAEEFAPNNALPWRNHSVRSVLRSDLARHTPKATDITCSATPTLYHSNNRNTRYYKQTPPSESIQILVPTEPLNLSSPRFISLDIDAGKMYWADPGVDKIFRANLDGGGGEVVIEGLPGSPAPWGVALDIIRGKIYWTDAAEKKIQSSDLDGGSIVDVLTSLDGIDVPHGITVDSCAGKIYWADEGANKVQRANLDGSDIEDLVTSDGAYGVALDLDRGKIYWTDIVAPGSIRRANLDGSSVETIVTSGLTNPYSIAVDSDIGKIYWTNDPGAFGTISRADLDGSNIEVLISEVQSSGIALDTDAGILYWTDYGADIVSRANMPEKPVYDNGFITHAIPQCSLQYSWIKASAITDRTQLLGYQSSGSN